MEDSNKKSQAACAEGNTIAQQALAAIRTVYSFNAEAITKRAYEATLDMPERMGVRQSWVIGVVLGSFQLFMFGAYGLALWYAAGRIRAGAYDGGTVMTVFFSALIGGFSVGQAGPSISAFSNGCSAGGRLFSVIDRKPAIDLKKPGKKIKVRRRGVFPSWSFMAFRLLAAPEKLRAEMPLCSIGIRNVVAATGTNASGLSVKQP